MLTNFIPATFFEILDILAIIYFRTLFLSIFCPC